MLSEYGTCTATTKAYQNTPAASNGRKKWKFHSVVQKKKCKVKARHVTQHACNIIIFYSYIFLLEVCVEYMEATQLVRQRNVCECGYIVLYKIHISRNKRVEIEFISGWWWGERQ